MWRMAMVYRNKLPLRTHKNPHDVPVESRHEQQQREIAERKAEFRASPEGKAEFESVILGMQLLSDIADASRVASKRVDAKLVEPCHCRRVITVRKNAKTAKAT